MKRILDLALIAVAVGGAVWTFQTKHRAEQSTKHLASLKAQIAAQNRKITLLEADMAIATNPLRLANLAEQFESQLKLGPLESSQIADLTELPALRTDRHMTDEERYAEGESALLTGSIPASEADGLSIGDLIQREATQ